MGENATLIEILSRMHISNATVAFLVPNPLKVVAGEAKSALTKQQITDCFEKAVELFT